MSAFDTKKALAHFKKADTTMAQMFSRSLVHARPIEIPKGRPKSKYFERIAASIVSQQISTKAADSVWAKFEKGVGKVTPENLKNRTVDELRTYGLSRQKANYIIQSANIWETLPTARFAKMENEEVIIELTKLYGIGRWTAEMFLMFTLARPDVFSYGDWGLMSSLKTNYGMKLHHKKKIEKLVNSWSPYRTLASLTLWHHKDT